jgi:hypothetical protein
LVFRAKPMDPPDDPLAELESAMAAAEMKLLQPDQDAETPAVAEATLPRKPDPDAFLFAPTPAPGDFPAPGMLHAPQPALQQAAANEAAASAVAEGQAGTFPDPALMTPKTLHPPQAEAEQSKSEESHDPLAPLRAMSEAQKIALFS